MMSGGVLCAPGRGPEDRRSRDVVLGTGGAPRGRPPPGPRRALWPRAVGAAAFTAGRASRVPFHPRRLQRLRLRLLPPGFLGGGLPQGGPPVPHGGTPAAEPPRPFGRRERHSPRRSGAAPLSLPLRRRGRPHVALRLRGGRAPRLPARGRLPGRRRLLGFGPVGPLRGRDPAGAPRLPHRRPAARPSPLERVLRCQGIAPG